jgi:hypothetical protein
MLAMFTDWKATTTFILPGKVSDPKGFKKDGDKVTHDMVGADLIKGFDKMMTKDTPALRKMIRDAGTLKPLDTKEMGAFAEFMPASVGASATLTDMGKDLFDYNKEMKSARDGTKDLRDKFKIDSKKQLPWEKAEGSASPPPPR